ncbi:MAG: sugar phosphate isomerase/epimerase family protein [Novosphingobium sp.]
MKGGGHPLAIELISAHGLNPVDMVHLCADLGVPRIGLAQSPVITIPEGRPSWNLGEDPALHRAVQSALRERGVRVVLGEGFLIHPQMAMANSAANLDRLAELGTERVNCVGLEPDEARMHDEFALFASLAAERGLAATIEYMPFVAVDSLDKAIACVSASGLDSAGILLDSMHVFRTGTDLAAIAALPLERIGHVQLCDSRAGLDAQAYMACAKSERLAPGTGELPLHAFLDAIPDGLTVGLEVPQMSLALSGMDDRERLNALIEACRSFSTDLL